MAKKPDAHEVARQGFIVTMVGAALYIGSVFLFIL
jgi:hypothetical protein